MIRRSIARPRPMARRPRSSRRSTRPPSRAWPRPPTRSNGRVVAAGYFGVFEIPDDLPRDTAALAAAIADQPYDLPSGSGAP
jgi:hypothetical protein